MFGLMFGSGDIAEWGVEGSGELMGYLLESNPVHVILASHCKVVR